jgi:excisionase family DNA binding protein
MQPAIAQRIAAVPSLEDVARDPGRARRLSTRTIAALQTTAAAALAALAVASLAADDMAEVHSQRPPETGLLTTRQMAEYLKVKESWVASEARADRIPKRMVGRYVRFDPLEVERSLSQREVV